MCCGGCQLRNGSAPGVVATPMSPSLTMIPHLFLSCVTRMVLDSSVTHMYNHVSITFGPASVSGGVVGYTGGIDPANEIAF